MAQHQSDTSKTKGRGFRKSVLSTDDAAAGPAMEGILRKKNSRGIWQKRYFWVNNCYLNWCGEKKSVANIKGALNLLESDEIVAPNRHGDITLSFNDGVKVQLRAKNGSEANEWVSCLLQRKQYFSRVQQASNRTLVADTLLEDEAQEAPSIEGWLHKKSGDYREKYQERFVKLYPAQGDLQYFKRTRTGEKQAGVVATNNIDWVRPYDESPDCAEFEFLSASRVFRWKAESSAVMQRWITELNAAIQVAREVEARYELARVEANTSSRIIEFDSSQAKEELVRENVEMIFGSCDGQEVEVLAQAIEYATDDLLELASDCEAAPGRPARLDILKFQLGIFHDRVLVEVQRFFDSRLHDAEQAFLYQLISLICSYSSVLTDLSARLPEADRPVSPLLSLIGQLSDNFVNGSKGTVAQARQICTAAAERQMREGKDGVQQQSDDLHFHTATAVDIWENINSQVQLAAKTQSAALQYMVVEGAMNAFLEMTLTLTEDLGSPGVVEERGSEYVCATMNDCTLHMDQLLDLPDMMSDPEIMQRIEPLIDRATHSLIAYGDAGVRALARGIMGDLSQTLLKVFSNEWRDGTEQPAATVAATMQDYLNEYEAVVGDYHHKKLCMDLCSRTVVTYLGLLAKKLSSSTIGVKIGGMKLDPPVINRMFDDLRTIELCFVERIRTTQRAGPFVLLDDVKAFLSAKDARIQDVVRSAAAGIPAADSKPYREALEGALSLLLKSRQDLGKNATKQLLDACMGIIEDTVEDGEGGSTQAAQPGPYDRATLYLQVFSRKNIKAASNRAKRGSIAVASPTGSDASGGGGSQRFGAATTSIEEEEILTWMQNADANMQATRVKSMHADFTAAQEAEAKAEASKQAAQDGGPSGASAAEASLSMEGYLEKKPHGSKKWNKRWFTLKTELQPSGEVAVVLTWSKNPKTPAIHDVQMTPECPDNYTYVSEATEPIVRDETTGDYYTAADRPHASPVKLKGTKMNIMTVMTAERKFKLRGGSPTYIIQWVNALNQLLKAKAADVPLDSLMDEESRRSFALGDTIVSSGSVASLPGDGFDAWADERPSAEKPPAPEPTVAETAAPAPAPVPTPTTPEPAPTPVPVSNPEPLPAPPSTHGVESGPPTSPDAGPTSPTAPRRSSLKLSSDKVGSPRRKKSVSFGNSSPGAAPIEAGSEEELSHSFKFPSTHDEEEEEEEFPDTARGRRKEQRMSLSGSGDMHGDPPVARCCVVS